MALTYHLYDAGLKYTVDFQSFLTVQLFWVKLFLKMLECVDSKNPDLISVLATVSLLPLHELFRRCSVCIKITYSQAAEYNFTICSVSAPYVLGLLIAEQR